MGVQRAIKDRKLEGNRFLAGVEPDGGFGAVPEHFTYLPHRDGGFTLYFAEPGLFGPSDYFHLWDPVRNEWRMVVDTELPPD